MQNFPNSPVPLHPGFSRRGSVVSSPYQSHTSDLQISPRSSEDYAAMQQAQPNLLSQGQHLHLRSQQHLLHASPVHAYGSRRVAGEMTQGNAHSGSSYRKESMDYYFSVSGRERNRRGYGAGFRYTNMDGHAPHQYQHLSGSGSSSGMISPYPMDYGSNPASGVGAASSSSSSSSGSGGAGSFSPSQQYGLTHNTPVQSGTPMQQRQHGQKYPSHQELHHHRAYSLSGNRVPSQFGHYAPINATSGSTGMYNSPPQRYDVSSSGKSTDAKINNSPTRPNPSASALSSCENVGHSYSSATLTPYSPQSLHKHAPHSQRASQSTIAGYDPSLKVQHHAPAHPKMSHSSIPSSPALPPLPCHEMAKSPMHSQNHQTRIHQNYSPISNPSPAPSAVQSPGCSSSSSPLMGSSEGNSTVAQMQASSLPVLNAHSSQSHGRLLQAVSQLSPTPSSNSSVSSCGSSLGTKTVGFGLNAGMGQPAANQNRASPGPHRRGTGEDSSLFNTDTGLNSLNALTSQVENLPNTVQHMLLTDTVLSQKKSKEQGSQSVPEIQNKCASSIVGGQTAANEERSETKGVQRKRVKKASGTNNESEPASYPLSQTHMLLERSQHGLDLQVNARVISAVSKLQAAGSQSKTPENPSSPPQPPSVHPSAELSTKPPSTTKSTHQKCVPERTIGHVDNNGMMGQKMIKDEESDVEMGDPISHREKFENNFNKAETDSQQCDDPNKHINISEQHNVGGVGVIVSARSEINAESSKHSAAKTSQCAISQTRLKHGCPEGQHDVSILRETRNHNGDREICMEAYVSPYDMSPKEEAGQRIPSNNSHTHLYKYNNPEVHSNTCMSTKNKGKSGRASEAGTNRYSSHHQLQASYGSIATKDISVFAGEGGRGVVSKGLESSSPFQPSFPSLLQEVLQGHHLDRRYGHPDQTSSVRNRSQDHRYQTRPPYSTIENLSLHGMAGTNVLFSQIATGKPHNFSQNQGPDKELALGPRHPTWESEAQRPNLTHEMPLEKGKTSPSPSHMQQKSDLPTGAPPKHIHLTDYSLQHRKASIYGTSPSAVEQLLLQETEPLTCAVGPISQTSSSGRRSVICDVSPSRRTTPERDRGTSGPSVIQQSFSASNDQDCSKEDIKVKNEQNNEDAPKIDPAGHNADGFCSIPAVKHPHKSLHPYEDVGSDSERISCVKGPCEPASNLTHFTQMSSNQRHQSYSQAVDAFRTYVFSDTMDGPKMISHSTPHRPFHTGTAYSKTTPSPNKLQAFSPSVPPQDQPDWTSDRYRLKDMDRHVSQRLAEHNSQSPSGILPSQHHMSPRQHSYSASHFDMKMWDVYPEPAAVPREHVGSPPVTNTVPKLRDGDKISDKSAEETAKSFNSLAPESGVRPSGQTNKAIQGSQRGQRLTKSGGSAETNPLIMRRRVRSFISPIPAKRQHQDGPVQRPASSYHSPSSHSDSRHVNNNSSGNTDTQPKLASPTTQQSNANSPPQCKTKILSSRKGRGLKLEAIVQKITPSVKKLTVNNSHIDSDYSDVSLYASDVPDPESCASFSSVAQVDEGCLSYLDDAYRAVEDAFSCDTQSLKPVAATSTPSGALRDLPKDFDFGLGAAGSSGSLVGENDKDDFTLLGPLPPPPPLPCPVQGSPPPSSSALSDIQQFTNTYQQLETRRGEQSAANLLRQKLQETGMGFDEYAAGDYYSTAACHSPGHHHPSRASQHQMTSLNLSSPESKSSESHVPKGYFPSGKKKGRPVGSVNKQKRAQAPIQNAAASIVAASLASPSTSPQRDLASEFASDVPQTSTPPDQEPCPSVESPVQMQIMKVDTENEETQPEEDVKPARPKQKKVKEGNEAVDSGVGQGRRRGMSSKVELDVQSSSRGNMGLCGIFSDARNNIFCPYIHVEQKIAEIGAVCTIVNGEEEKSKSGAKAGHFGMDALLNTSVSSQLARREKENERSKESWVSEQVDSALQSGKTLPSSGFVLPGPVSVETGHTGRLVCCLCQKWANYKNLGDLYGPFYPAEYAAMLPRNTPQIRQTLSYQGPAATGLDVTISRDPTPQDSHLQDPQNVKLSTDSDCTANQATNPTSPATTFGTASPEEMPFQNTKTSSFASKVATHSRDQQADQLASGLGGSKVQEADSVVVLKQLQLEDSQQRPQHRKLTSHPRFKRRHKSSEDLPGRVPINSKASLPFQPPPPSLDFMGPMAQLAQLPLVPIDPEELWVHESCIVWTSGVYLVNGRLYGLQEALDGARDASCSHCDIVGSTLGCYSKGCTQLYHYLCAIEADCSLNEENFSLRCPKHKSNRLVKPGAAYLEQSERG
ncbi:transcription factor 20 [Triplophysa dalaica]|uniref:transcription factor 20 n=1 Tax=Triplophysa dalaica TaxID=1582913 RepID=UPI0024DF4150|nr:transcription factor 20 [Triplophysa dalaica]XP_056607986.1 transcription factor 20 [Triplophysa dalaica]XP_056607987.1 transcription factor 20 [Triplophysa dalaica]XP_056607988.1 transcription factor 20 [Triplophysa dalaica]XP_056607989.1 transcription factor 20 [Triplophysa dalaica]